MSDKPAPSIKLNWFVYFFDILFAGVAITATITMILLSAFREVLIRYNFVIEMIYLGTLVLAIVISIFWYFQKTTNTLRTLKLHAWMLGVLRYWLAYEISVYGFAKILKTQFGTMYSQSDTVIGSLNGLELTWNYFGFSYTLAVILGLLQIGGSVLLLFRKTTLLGICMLMPIMVNIVLINIFYSIAKGAFLNSLLITGGLTYLLILRWSQLKEFFLNTRDNIPPIRLSFAKPALKIIIIVGAFFTIYQFVSNDKPVDFLGKWKVEMLERNGVVVDENAWINNADNWKCIYIEQRGKIFLSPNPYVFEKARATRAEYHYDKKKKTLQLIFQKEAIPADTALVKIISTDKNKMEWNTVYEGNKLKLKLSKAEPVAIE